MAQQLIAFPFRLTPNGSAVVQEDYTEEYFTGELAALLGTTPGERITCPSYGVDDLVFNAAAVYDLQAQIEMFGPPVVVRGLDVVVKDNQTVNVTVQWDIEDEDDNTSDYSVGD